MEQVSVKKSMPLRVQHSSIIYTRRPQLYPRFIRFMCAGKLGRNRLCRHVSKVQGFMLQKNPVLTKIDELRKNSDEFQTQFDELSGFEA